MAMSRSGSRRLSVAATVMPAASPPKMSSGISPDDEYLMMRTGFGFAAGICLHGYVPSMLGWFSSARMVDDVGVLPPGSGLNALLFSRLQR